MATWPGTLPDPQIEGYGLKQASMVVSTEMEAGNTKSRRRSLVRYDKFSVKWILSETQMAAFRTWFDDATTGANGGQAWFTVNLNTGSGVLASSTARFVGGNWDASYVTVGIWQVSAQLEVRYA